MTLSEFQDALQRLSAPMFEELVLELFQRQERISELAVSPPTADGGVDFVGIEEVRPGAYRVVWIEVKHRKLVGVDVARYMVGRSRLLPDSRDEVGFILVVSGAVTPEAQRVLREAHIELWDPPRLAPLITPEIASRFFGTRDVPPRDHPPSGTDEPSKAARLSAELKALPCGRKHWSEFQRLMAEILEFLFCPPLDAPLYEFADAVGKNRRDLIFENPAAEGYWAQARLFYAAHYVVADAKNYCALLTKSPVLEIGHYLKPYGCGMFALLVSRYGVGDAGEHAIREQWVAATKMIVSVKDDDIQKMLAARGAGGRPEEIVRRLVADFRMRL